MSISNDRMKIFSPMGRLPLVVAIAVLLLVPMTTMRHVLGQVAKTAAEDEDEIPPPIVLKGNDLITKDGVQLAATFYPGTEGKDSIPVILLHMHKSDQKAFATIAPFLQEKGHAVLVPDLRGHGDSTTAVFGEKTKELDISRLSPEQFSRMVRYDMETLKGFLMKEHNQGNLNIEKLCVLGAEMGASVAAEWARHDWSWPVLVGKKQGQDVKALVLISPKWSFPGLDLRNAMTHPALQTKLSILIIVGKGHSRSVSDAKRVHTMLDRFRQPPPGIKVKPSLFLGLMDTKLQGTKMLDVQTLRLDQAIAKFIDMRLVQQQIVWRER